METLQALLDVHDSGSISGVDRDRIRVRVNHDQSGLRPLPRTVLAPTNGALTRWALYRLAHPKVGPSTGTRGPRVRPRGEA